MLFKEIPAGFKKYFKPFKKKLSKKQIKHFSTYVTGLIVCDNKTIQEINDNLSDTNQSSLNRFLTLSQWDTKKIDHIRLNQIKKKTKPKKGIAIFDPTFIHKTWKHMEKVSYQRSGVTKKKELGFIFVDSLYVEENNSFPIAGDFYVPKNETDEDNPFRTQRQICIDQLHYALEQKLPIWLVMIDAGLYADFFLQEIKSLELKYIAGVRTTNSISINGQKRISIWEYLNTLTDNDFQYHFIKGKAYWLHTLEINTRGVGKEKLLISYKSGGEEEIKIYTTNILDKEDKDLMNFLVRRWDIECLHRDAKQHLGLEDYQVRKFGAMQKVACAVLVAYTLLVLCKKTLGILMRIQTMFKRGLKTIGELCRFMQIVAQKGWRWIIRKARDPGLLREILNKHVLVKNAKV
ncbi:MAG: IS701 family transposase [Candidatus Woesearchaeota archaeon]